MRAHMRTAVLAVVGLVWIAGTATAQVNDPRASRPAQTKIRLPLEIADDKPVWVDPPLPPIELDQTLPPKESPKEQTKHAAPADTPHDTAERGMTWEDVGDICLIVLIAGVCFAGFLYFLSGIERH